MIGVPVEVRKGKRIKAMTGDGLQYLMFIYLLYYIHRHGFKHILFSTSVHRAGSIAQIILHIGIEDRSLQLI